MNLLIRDLDKVFEAQFLQCGIVEKFFRTRHAARLAYIDVMEETKGTYLAQPVATGSIELLQSVFTNRSVIEGAIMRLRREKFHVVGNELMFV